MPIKQAVAYTQIDDSWAAGNSAMTDVMQKLDGQPPDFLLIFATVGHDFAKLFQGIRAVAGDIPLSGCSGAGIITHLGCDEATHSLAIMGLQSDRVRFDPFIVPGLSHDSGAIGKEIGKKIKSLGVSENDKQLLVLLPDGLTINADLLFHGIEDALGYHIDLIGGTAGNDYHISQTYQFCNEKIMNDAVAGFLIWGDFNYHIGVSHGSKPIGSFKTITQAAANIIYEIDHQPALELLQSFLGAERLSDFGQTINLIGLGESFDGKGYSENIINRAILGIDEANLSIKIGAQMPVGSMFRMTRRDKLKVKKGTQNMVSEVLQALRSPDEAAYFYFNCSGRGSYLFGEPTPDVNNLLEVLGPDQEMIGFFTFGEIAPVDGNNYFHNYTGIFVGIE